MPPQSRPGALLVNFHSSCRARTTRENTQSNELSFPCVARDHGHERGRRLGVTYSGSSQHMLSRCFAPHTSNMKVGNSFETFLALFSRGYGVRGEGTPISRNNLVALRAATSSSRSRTTNQLAPFHLNDLDTVIPLGPIQRSPTISLSLSLALHSTPGSSYLGLSPVDDVVQKS